MIQTNKIIAFVFLTGETCGQDCLIICDRGAMDASAFILKDKWESLMAKNDWNMVELRDNRYNQIIHMVKFYLIFVENVGQYSRQKEGKYK